MSPFTNVISIHLRRFKSVEDFERVLKDNELELIDPEGLYNLMLEGYTKVFIDKTTYKLLGYCHQTEKRIIQITEDFIDYLKMMNSITFVNNEELSVDKILDKINSSGLESLTKREKEFLKNNS